LLGNATTYAPASGRIGLSAALEGDHVVITIGNTNDQLAKDDLPHLFESFWRKDSARTDGSHSGLGLSLVAAMLSLMGGTVRVVLNPPGWIQFVVTLPAA
ncbi:MAG: two-component system, OmpR family, sensor histidine kinase BaeS, partial [Myxococcales bacterium]|nr:two-component system, OmpR family, sensor histidine kinase BaeS [Myxococcales bacterium]